MNKKGQPSNDNFELIYNMLSSIREFTLLDESLHSFLEDEQYCVQLIKYLNCNLKTLKNKAVEIIGHLVYFSDNFTRTFLKFDFLLGLE